MSVLGNNSRIAQRLFRHRRLLLLLALVLAAMSFYPAQLLRMDRRIENLFASGDPLLAPHYRLKELFGGNEIVMCLYDDPELLHENESGMRRLERIRATLRKIPGVKGVLSLDMPIGARVVNDHFVSCQIRELLQGYTHGADGRTACVACMLEQVGTAEGEPSRERTIADIRQAMQNLPDGLCPGMIAGEPVMIHDAFRSLEIDGYRLMWSTSVLLGMTILICFRSLRWVVIPLLVVQWALLLTKGLLWASKMQLSMVSSMLTAVVTVVGIGTVVHVIVRFREGLQLGLNPERTLIRTLSILAIPVFWACVTDAVGFAALLAAHVAPVREFGMMMALGSIMVLIGSTLLIPGLSILFPLQAENRESTAESVLKRHLSIIIQLVDRHPKMVSGVMLSFSLAASIGILWLQTETDFTRNFRPSSEIVKSYQVVESKLGGAGVCDLILPAENPLSMRYLLRILKLEARLRREVQVLDSRGEQQSGLTKVISLADLVIRASPRDLLRARRSSQQFLINTGLRVMKESIPEFYDAMYTEDRQRPGDHYYRVMLRALERQPAPQKRQIIDQVRTITAEEFPEGQVTGYFVLLTNLIDSILRDQWRTFGVALLGIFFIMTVALRNMRLALIALVPSVVPILVVNGMMGWLGLRVNMGGAMIAAVSMGLAIDGSIHYLIAYQRARKSHSTVLESLAAVQQTVGKGMVFSTLALTVGFAALSTSPFIPTVYFGTLVSISMLCTLIGTLLWLPLLIRWVEIEEKTQRTAEPLQVIK